jgi:hypothetical protein
MHWTELALMPTAFAILGGVDKFDPVTS